MQSFFPFFIDISGKHFLVVGAGAVGRRRIHSLMNFSCIISVVDPHIDEEIKKLYRNSENLKLAEKEYTLSDLQGIDFCLAATNDRELNERIVRDARQRMIPVNNASDRQLCDFYFPGIVKEDPVTVGICASGVDHRLAGAVTEWIKDATGRFLRNKKKENLKS